MSAVNGRFHVNGASAQLVVTLDFSDESEARAYALEHAPILAHWREYPALLRDVWRSRMGTPWRDQLALPPAVDALPAELRGALVAENEKSCDQGKPPERDVRPPDVPAPPQLPPASPQLVAARAPRAPAKARPQGFLASVAAVRNGGAE